MTGYTSREFQDSSSGGFQMCRRKLQRREATNSWKITYLNRKMLAPFSRHDNAMWNADLGNLFKAAFILANLSIGFVCRTCLAQHKHCFKKNRKMCFGKNVAKILTFLFSN